MHCTNCGHKNAQDANFCGGCGAAINKPKPPSKKNKQPYLAGLLALLIAGYGYATDWTFQWPNESEVATQEEPMKNEKKLTIKKAATVVNETAQQSKDKTELIKESLPSVFTIGTDEGMGSGFLYKSGGYIVTNAHVVAGYTDVLVRNSKGKDFEGKVIGISDRYDIALIKSEANKNVKAFVTETNETPIGTEVIALGSPQGFENTASIGYLTGLNRDMEMDFIYEKIYQIDAQIDQGSSGGPLLDANTGKVIGINSLLYKENAAFGFSIPMHSMQSLVDKWIDQPMSSQAVAALFNVYEDYIPETYQASGDTFWDFEEYYDYDGTEDEEIYEDYEEGPEPEAEEYVEDTDLEDEDVAYFIQSFRSEYEEAIDYDDYSYIASYIASGSSAESELSAFLEELSMKNEYYEFLTTSITDIVYHEQSIEVYTYETLNFTTEEGDVKYLEKNKVYTLISDGYGDYAIEKIANR